MANTPKSKLYLPTVFVIFGATGDLSVNKIIPALFHLFKKKQLPLLLKIYGFSRRKWDHPDFRNFIQKVLLNSGIEENDVHIAAFLKHIFYQQGDFAEGEDYRLLAKDMGRVDDEWSVCANKLFYLAVPPKYYSVIFTNLATSGLTIPCSPEEGWTRVIVEKPFGHDLSTSQKLDEQLSKLFKEEQIYRMDHYLAKEMLQNIMSFRFSNNLLEPSWNNKYIEKIEIRVLETVGVESRGVFYDGIGALRDVGQNHLLQMLAAVTMDKPDDFTGQQIRLRRAEVLRTLLSPNDNDIKKFTFRAQHEGYLNISGVAPKSQTETYFSVKAMSTSPRWRGVPIYLESGKRMNGNLKEIKVTFKHTTPCLCPPGKGHFHNEVQFRLDPKEEIEITFISKKPGQTMDVEERTFDFLYRENEHKEEYQKLLLDCIEGNQTFFTSTDEVKAMWNFTDPITEAWKKNSTPLTTYVPDKNEIRIVAKKFISSNVETAKIMKKEMGIVGLGKMGGGIALQLNEKGWRIVGSARSQETVDHYAKQGIIPAYNLEEMVEQLAQPRVLWLMLPAGETVENTLFGENGIIHLLDKGDIVVDAGNSNYNDAKGRQEKLRKKGIQYVDVGVSGGPGGARYGACVMVGGTKKLFEYLLPVYTDISLSQAVAHFEGMGAGHFVKMVHNGIEYGMMQSIGEGFEVIKKSPYKLDLQEASRIYNKGSVIESRLVGWLEKAYREYGTNLEGISGSVNATGEGEWTVLTANKFKVPVKVIEESFIFRKKSKQKPSYTGKVVSALRNQFGGHEVKEQK